jgi:hypothetical protein
MRDIEARMEQQLEVQIRQIEVQHLQKEQDYIKQFEQ